MKEACTSLLNKSWALRTDAEVCTPPTACQRATRASSNVCRKINWEIEVTGGTPVKKQHDSYEGQVTNTTPALGLALERRNHCTGFLSFLVAMENNEVKRKRGFCQVCHKKVQSYCFGCKAYLCLKIPDNDSRNSKYEDISNYVSIKDENNKEMLLENNCWLMHHSEGMNCYFHKKKESTAISLI